jgi:large conductance mechanosensitive channel
VRDLIMPVIGRVVGGLDFSNYYLMLSNPPAGYTGPMTYEALTKAGVPLFAYGNFLTVALNFIILAFIIFLIVRSANKMMRRQDEAAGPTEIDLLTEIRDELKRRP